METLDEQRPPHALLWHFTGCACFPLSASGHRGFQAIAETYLRGHGDLAIRGLNEVGGKKLRWFCIGEVTKYRIPVAPARFRRVLSKVASGNE